VGVRAGVGLTVGARVGAEVGEAVGIDAAFAGQEGHESQPYNKKPRKKLTSKTSVGRLWKIVVKLIKFRDLLQIGWMGFHPEVSPAFTFLQVPAAHLTGFDLQVDFGTHRQEAPHLMQLGILDSAQSPTADPTRIFFPTAQGGPAVYIHQQPKPWRSPIYAKCPDPGNSAKPCAKRSSAVKPLKNHPPDFQKTQMSIRSTTSSHKFYQSDEGGLYKEQTRKAKTNFSTRVAHSWSDRIWSG